MKSFIVVLMLILGKFSFVATDESLENYHSDYEIEEEIKLLKYLGEMDEKLCVDLSHNLTEHKKKLYLHSNLRCEGICF